MFKKIVSFIILSLSISWGQWLMAEKAQISYMDDVQKIFDRRCVQCHSCYSAPCQLKLTSYRGFKRGLNHKYKDIYNFSVFAQGDFTDPDVTRHHKQWDEAGFSPIANVRDDGKRIENDENNSFVSTLVKQRTENSDYVHITAEEARSCPKTRFGDDDSLSAHLKKNPNMGMPYGLPALSQDDIDTLSNWAKMGSPGPTVEKLKEMNKVTENVAQKIKDWQNYLNVTSKKRRLISRYIFEHLFLAHIYFESPQKDKDPQFFRLVRSRNECPAQVGVLNEGDEFVARRPWDLQEVSDEKQVKLNAVNEMHNVRDIKNGGRLNRPIKEIQRYTDGIPKDGEKRLYYCFQKYNSTIVHKSHLVYDMSGEKLTRIQKLFDESSIELKEEDPLPSRDHKYAANPFKTFDSIPEKARYQFLLDNANYFVRSFIRGPVCRGSIALNSIQDRFWVFFIDPKYDRFSTDLKNPSVNSPTLKDRRTEILNFISEKLTVPTQVDGSNVGLFELISRSRLLNNSFINAIIGEGKNKEEYLEYRSQLKSLFGEYNSAESKTFKGNSSVKQIWNGSDSFGTAYLEDKNPQALQTIFRHEDSASAHVGLIGAPSKTLFVLDYSVFERLYYALVAGYDVFGSAFYQVLNRDYMSFLRMDAEDNFLSFMPSDKREKVRNYWSRKDIEEHKDLKKSKLIPDLKAKNKVALNMQKWVLKNLNTGKPSSVNKVVNEMEHLGDLFLTQQIPAWKSKTIKTQIDFYSALKALELREQKNAAYVKYFPSLTYILVRDEKIKEDGSIDRSNNRVYSITKTNAQYNVDSLFEEGRRDENSDHLIVSDQFIGSYPNFFFDIQLSQAKIFFEELHKRKEGEITELEIMMFKRFFGRFGAPYNKKDKDSILYTSLGTDQSGKYNEERAQKATAKVLKRSHEKFWETYDEILRIFKLEDPVQYGVLDLNRYEATDNVKGKESKEEEDPLEADYMNP